MSRAVSTGEAVAFAVGTGAIIALGSFAANAGGFQAYPVSFVGERIAEFAMTAGLVVAVVSIIHNWLID